MSQAFHGGRLREARERFGREDFLDFSVNTNAFWTAPVHLCEQDAHAAWTRYPEADAALPSQRLAQLFGGVEEHLQATAGAIEALYLATRLFPNKSALVLQPGFADYARACSAAGLARQSLLIPPRNQFLQPFIPKLATADVVILGTPANPTGTLFRDLPKILPHPALRHVSWILDEAFIDFVPGGAPAHSFLPKLNAYPQIILLGALTKSWGLPGLRLGFAASSNRDWMRQLRAMQPPWSINGLAENWARNHLTSHNLAEMRRSLVQLPEVRFRLQNQLSSIDGLRVFESDANFLLIESSGLNASEIADSLGAKGILVRVCEGFEGLDSLRFFRVAVKRPEENDRLVKALQDMTGNAPVRVHSGIPATSENSRLRAISVLGTSSNSGKSWLATALCALLRRRGMRVAPFKAQNMSNNSAVAWDGGEIGRAQAAQAEACKLAPSVRMNPILLKPSGGLGSQLVVLGKARGHVLAADYYRHIDALWPVVTESLAYWESRADVLILEGAGSPVELNLLHRDLVNFRPMRHLGGRWILVADIERGGVFAQAAGTWNLSPREDRNKCLGLVVNKFRGDLSLFADASRHFAPHFGAPHLGTLPFRSDLQPEDEDSLCVEPFKEHCTDPSEPCIHWIRFPHISNSQDAEPWIDDSGIHIRWTTDPRSIAEARVIVLPGSKNTLSDLAWLHETGWAEAIRAAHKNGSHVVGICGGFQMLGADVSDPEGLAGDDGTLKGLGLLPVRTVFSPEKEVRNVTAEWEGERWSGYEIHMGQTHPTEPIRPLLRITESDLSHGSESVKWREEGAQSARVWGTYVHGFFESTRIRKTLARIAGATKHQTPDRPWRERRQQVYDGMADLLEEHLQLEPVWRYVAD
jgi:adenosylcobyric acid synthase